MKKIFVLTLLCILGVSVANAQALLNRMAKMAAEKVENSMMDDAEEEVDQELDEMEEQNVDEESATESTSSTSARSSSNSGSGTLGMSMLSRMGIAGEPIEIEDSYSFKSSITANMKSYEADGTLASDGDLITFLTPGDSDFAYEFTNNTEGEEATGFFIIDFDKSATIILSEADGEKSGLVYGFKDYAEDMDEEVEASEDTDMPEQAGYNPNVRKTGRSKKILGYSCDEYEYEDDISKASYWITKELDMETSDYMSNIFKTSLYSHGMPWGYMLECNSLDKQSGSKSDYVVTGIEKNADKSIDLDEYQISNFGNMMMPEDE